MCLEQGCFSLTEKKRKFFDDVNLKEMQKIYVQTGTLPGPICASIREKVYYQGGNKGKHNLMRIFESFPGISPKPDIPYNM